jgi:hypothetical protein
MAMLADTVDGVIGVDPHRDTLAAAAVTDQVGGVLAQTTTSTDTAGYQYLLGLRSFDGARSPSLGGGRRGQLRRRAGGVPPAAR